MQGRLVGIIHSGFPFCPRDFELRISQNSILSQSSRSLIFDRYLPLAVTSDDGFHISQGSSWPRRSEHDRGITLPASRSSMPNETMQALSFTRLV